MKSSTDAAWRAEWVVKRGRGPMPLYARLADVGWCVEWREMQEPLGIWHALQRVLAI